MYENNSLVYFAAAEGRVRVNGATHTNEYVITDTQGNSRISFEDNGQGLAVIRQENSYYPFGLVMGNGITPSAQPNKQLYNAGSEWQNDYANGLPDYYETFYRNYDAAIGRFVGVDPMPDAADSWSVYQYAYNNPGMLNDPIGDLVGGSLYQDYSHGIYSVPERPQPMSRWEADANASADLFFSQSTNLFLDLLKKDRAHTASMASLLGVVSAKDFSVDRYLEVQGILLNEVNVKIGSQASADAVWGSISSQIQTLNSADAPSYFYRNASKQLGKAHDYIGEAILEGAKFYAYGAIGGYVLRPVAGLIGKGFSSLASRLTVPTFVEAGVYDLETSAGRYIGQSKNMFTRVMSHIAKGGKLAKLGVSSVSETFHAMPGSSKLEREAYEQYLIRDAGLDNLINNVNPMGGRMMKFESIIDDVITKYNLPRVLK